MQLEVFRINRNFYVAALEIATNGDSARSR